MVSKYPQQTAMKKVAQQALPASGPGYQVPTKPVKPVSVPSNDNPTVKVLPKATKGLKGVLKIPKPSPVGAALDALEWWVSDVYIPALQGAGQHRLVKHMYPSKWWIWDPCPNPCGGPDVWRAGSYTCATPPACAAIQVQPGTLSQPPATASTSRRMHWIKSKNSNGTWSLSYVGAYDPRSPSGTRPTYQAFSVPDQGPMAWPIATPIAYPEVFPELAPASKPRPGEEPAAEPQPKPNPNPLPVTVPLPHVPGVPLVTITPAGFNDGWTWGRPTYVFHSDGGHQVTNRPPVNRPPGPGEKQKKVNIAQVGGALWVGLNMFTETMDFIEVLWDALPDKAKRKYIREERYGHRGFHRADIQSKMEDVYDNIDQIDVAQAIVGYINNAVEDWFYGIQGIPTKKVSQELGIATGLDAAIADGQKWADHQVLGDDYKISDLIPQIDYDAQTGNVTITSPFGDVKVVEVFDDE